jgi:hypothetical protein
VWVAVLLIQSLPYAASVVVSLVNALELPGAWIGEAGAVAPVTAEPARAPRPLLLRLLLRARDHRFFRRSGRTGEESLVEERP